MRLRCLWMLWLALLYATHLSSQSDLLYPNVETPLSNYREALIRQNKFAYTLLANISVEFNQANNSQFRISVTAGAAKAFAGRAAENYHPFIGAYQTELLLYRGGLGASQVVKERSKLHLEWRNQMTLTGGGANFQSGGFVNRVSGAPLNVFSGNSKFGLITPYDASVTIGTTFIHSFTDEYKQQVGGITATVLGGHASYCNEGPFFRNSIMPTGDGYDRWWTGGGQIGYYNMSSTAFISKVEIFYDKFTGWQPFAYEIASRLGLKHVPYKNSKEALLNQGRYLFAITMNDYFTAGMGIYEPRYMDVQNIIHTLIDVPFHQTHLSKRSSGLWSYSLFNFGSI